MTKIEIENALSVLGLDNRLLVALAALVVMAGESSELTHHILLSHVQEVYPAATLEWMWGWASTLAVKGLITVTGGKPPYYRHSFSISEQVQSLLSEQQGVK